MWRSGEREGRKLNEEKKKNGKEPTKTCALCESRHAKQRCGGCRERWYCSKECQTLHWKRGGHKQECRKLIQSVAEQACSDRLAHATHRDGKESDETSNRAGTPICAICLRSPESPVKLPCTHEFCRKCVDALRSRGLKQLCPLCRRPLPPGAEKLREQGVSCISKWRAMLVVGHFHGQLYHQLSGER